MKRPTLEEVSQYCAERGNTVDPQAWMDYYESVGFKIGKKPMVSWQAAVRTWERRYKTDGKQRLIDRITDRSWAD